MEGNQLPQPTVVEPKHPGGRPTVMTDAVLSKLEEAFLMDCSDEEACLFADIAPATLYHYQTDHPEFLERKKQLKKNPFLKARRTIYESLNDPDIAKWFLERKAKDEFSQRQEVKDVTDEEEKHISKIVAIIGLIGKDNQQEPPALPATPSAPATQIPPLDAQPEPTQSNSDAA